MTAHGGAPPGKGAGAQTTGDLDAGTVETLGGDYDRSIVDDLFPLYRSPEFDALDPDDPRRQLSMQRAADAWWRDGQPDAMRARLIDELADADLYARWRVRLAGIDIREAVDDWPGVYDVVQARREYRERWGVPA